MTDEPTAGSTPLPLTPTATDGPLDGRNARRLRNADAVVEAVIELLMNGDDQPTAGQIAERAGVSLRSVFRYFHDLDDLFTAAVLVQAERFGPYLAFDPPPADTPLDTRIEYLVGQRVRQYRAIAPVVRIIERRAEQIPELHAMINGVRANAPVRLAALFAPELDTLDDTERTTTVAAIHALTMIDGYLNLVERHRLDDDGIAGVYRTGLRRLLMPLAPAAPAPLRRYDFR